MSTALEDTLRSTFAERAADVGPAPDPYSRTMRAVGRSRSRRRATGAALAAFVVGAAALAVPTVRHAQQVAHDRRDPKAGDDLLRWPTRGDRAGDAVLLSRTARLFATRGMAVHSVIFAGDVAGRAVVLSVVPGSTDQANAGVLWSTVAVVYPVGGGEPTVTEPLALTDVANPLVTAAWVDAARVTHVLALTASSGTALALSPRLDYTADGEPARTFTPLTLHDGVGTAALGLGGSTVMTVAERHGSARRVTQVYVTADEGRPSTPAPTNGTWAELAATARSCRGLVTAQDVQNATGAVVQGAGLTNFTAGVVGCRALGGQAGTILEVWVEAPGRGSFQGVTTFTTDGSSHGWTSTDPLPVPRGFAATYPRLVGALVDGQLAPHLVIAPGAATAEVVPTSGGVALASGKLRDGQGLLTLDTRGGISGLSLVTRAPNGAVFWRVDLSRLGITDPLGLTIGADAAP